jgi:hypothetical protein
MHGNQPRENRKRKSSVVEKRSKKGKISVPSCSQSSSKINPCRQALNNKATTYKITGGEKDLPTFFKSHKNEIRTILEREIFQKQRIKWFMVMECIFKRFKSENEIETCSAFFRSICFTNLSEEDLESNIEMGFNKISSTFDSYEGHGSGWILENINGLELNIGEYTPLAPSSYIPLPKELSLKHAIINVQNTDHKCFLWSVLAGLYPASDNPQRVNKYVEHESKLNIQGIEFPTPINQVKTFEKNNSININIFGYDKKEIFPLYISKYTFETCINLLLLSSTNKNHYCYIKSMSRLLKPLTKHKAKSFYCNYCLHRYSSDKLLKEHVEICRKHIPQKIVYPNNDNKWCHFKNFFMQMRVPFVIYADFESFIVKTKNCENTPLKSHETILSHHIPCGYAYIVVDQNGKTFKGPVIYRGDNAVTHFLQSLMGEQEIRDKLKRNEKMIFTNEDRDNFKNATSCYICGGFLSLKRARDHCHITGKYRGATHPNCNLNYKIRNKIPVIFHNLRGYDSHLIMQSIGKFKDKEIECIPNNMQSYLSFSLGDLQFIDSLQFLPASLEKLASSLETGKFNIMREHFGNEEVKLLTRKGVYPYSYIDCHQKFLENSLPPKKAFYDDLNCQEISDDDYQYAQLVWERLNIQNLGEYHDLYLKTDILLLADIFQNFRELCLDYYDLDPAHCITLPSFAWNAALKKSKIKLELLTDPNMYLFFEEGIRGGISVISKRFSEANNKYLPNFDPEKPSKFIIYLDANNLYGWALSQPLPVSDFKWLSVEEINNFKPLEIEDDSAMGYVIEADIAYPENIHDDHDDYPLAPERVEIETSMLSEYCKNLAQEMQMPMNKPQTKLVPNLRNKVKYILHYRNLKLYLSLGMKLVKIHRILQFHQIPWLKPYVQFNTEKRKLAKNTFEKDLFKLMNNAVFGKTMENLRKRVNIKLVQTEKKFKKLISSPAFYSFQIFNPDLTAVHMHKTKLKLDRPIYVGFSVLDMSKILMYDSKTVQT